MGALSPKLSLLMKLGSLAVHIDEFLSNDNHPFDEVVIQGLLADKEVKTWLVEMDSMALLPKKRMEESK